MKYKYYMWVGDKKIMMRYKHMIKIYRNKVRSYYLFNHPQPTLNKKWWSASNELTYIQRDWNRYRDLYKEMTETEVMIEFL